MATQAAESLLLDVLRAPFRNPPYCLEWFFHPRRASRTGHQRMLEALKSALAHR